MRLRSFMLIFFCSIFCTISICQNTYANEVSLPISVKNCLDELILIEETLADFDNYSYFEKNELVNWQNEEQYDLYMLYDDNYIGYLIWDNYSNFIYEISRGIPVYMEYNDIDVDYIYDNGNYYIQENNNIYALDEYGNIINNVDSFGVSTRGIIGGVDHQLQGSYYCIPTALANVLYYWSNNGYSALNYKSSFQAMQTDITALFYGQQTNNNIVPRVVRNYVASYSSQITANAYVHWVSSAEYVKAEIDAGRPCMVGFAAGEGSYSTIEGHMTMCFGYIQTSSYCMLVLGDGHQTYDVYRVWNPAYNDCVISIVIS